MVLQLVLSCSLMQMQVACDLTGAGRSLMASLTCLAVGQSASVVYMASPGD